MRAAGESVVAVASMPPVPLRAQRSADDYVHREPNSGVREAREPAPKPVLASEVLAEELAPLEPGRLASRVWLLAVALLLALLGVALREGVGVPASRAEDATITFSAAGAVTALALLPFPYALRAAVSLLLALVLMTMGLRGAGPLSGLTVDGGELRALAMLVVLSTLPPALLLRARYSTCRWARPLLAIALGLAVPFLVLQVLLWSDQAAPFFSRLVAATNAGLIGCCLLGFAPDRSAGGSKIWAGLVVCLLPMGVALRELTPLADADTGLLTYSATATATVCAAILACLGGYQLLAAALGPRVRAKLRTRRPAGSD